MLCFAQFNVNPPPKMKGISSELLKYLLISTSEFTYLIFLHALLKLICLFKKYFCDYLKKLTWKMLIFQTIIFITQKVYMKTEKYLMLRH